MKSRVVFPVAAVVVAVMLAASPATVQAAPIPVTIILDNHFTATGTEGPFTATGGLNTSGFNVMDVRPTKSGTLHCRTVLTDANGSFTLGLECRMIPTGPTTAGGPGHWVVLSGTGAYANLHGTGSLTMDIDFVAGTAVETMDGEIFFDNGH
jgi:hypothetical protein